MAQCAGEVAFAGPGAADRDDVDRVLDEVAALQSLHLHSCGAIEAVEIQCPQRLSWQQVGLLAQPFGASGRLGGQLNTTELEQVGLVCQPLLGSA